MVEYEFIDSSFFRDNKLYCETIERKLKSLSVDCEGYCNCFGFELKSRFERDDLNYEVRFFKNQTTQNGVLFPIDAHEYAGTELVILGLNHKDKLNVGKSTLLRQFCLKEIKEKIAKPYFIRLRGNNEPNFIDNLVKIIDDNHISRIRLKKGKLTTIIHEAISDPIKLINDIEYIIKKRPNTRS